MPSQKQIEKQRLKRKQKKKDRVREDHWRVPARDAIRLGSGELYSEPRLKMSEVLLD